ncbi:MAG: hypothetical protein HYS08_10480 [Chlamydiae bacterium]|nr:hypothetical protein [Chlamydiota bacterium]MBI3266552.1 hypothetical protein [Chlamydiota bacterium]
MKKWILAFAILFSTSFLHAEEATQAEQKSEEKSKDQNTATTVVTYPVNVVREAGEVALGVGKKAVEVTADTAQTTGQVLTGDVKKTPEIVVTPVKGTAEGLVETATSTVAIPGEALKDSQEASK